MKKISTRLHAAHLLMALTLVLLSCMATAQINPYQYTINKMANGSKGAVSSAHPLASQVGLEILKNGGNAFDAAIATQLALAVVTLIHFGVLETSAIASSRTGSFKPWLH